MPQKFENIAGKISVVRALFNDREVGHSPELFPNLGELSREQLAKERADADVGEVIAVTSDGSTIARIITVIGMIKRLFHEPGE